MYLTDDAFSVKAKLFIQMFTSILALFFLLRIANKSRFYAPESDFLSFIDCIIIFFMLNRSVAFIL